MTTTTCHRRPGSRWTSCQCPKCRADMRRTSKARRFGLLPRDERDEALTVLRAWVEVDGYSNAAIADMTGLSRLAVYTMVKGLRTNADHRLAHASAAAVMKAVRADARPEQAGWVANIGAARRLQALAALGWTNRELEPLMGVPARTLDDIRLERRKSLMAWTAAAISDSYPVLKNTQGSGRMANLMRRHAAAHGWLPPGAWDDVDLDDPGAVPHPEWVRRESLQRLLKIEDIEWVLKHDPTMTADMVGARLGFDGNSILTHLSRAKRWDLHSLLLDNVAEKSNHLGNDPRKKKAS